MKTENEDKIDRNKIYEHSPTILYSKIRFYGLFQVHNVQQRIDFKYKSAKLVYFTSSDLEILELKTFMKIGCFAMLLYKNI